MLFRSFQVEKKRYRITRDRIVVGLRTVCDLEKFGFKNHNYLKRVLVPDAERISAEGLTAKEERKREEVKKERRSSDDRQECLPHNSMTPEAQAELKKKLGVRRFSELIGKDRK